MDSTQYHVNRRKFIKNSSAALLFASLSSYATPFFNDEKPKRVALIGTGWYGSSDLYRLIQVANVEVVALCDVDSKNLEHTAKIVAARQKSKQKPKLYKVYKEMLKNEKPEIVLIGTPDHWHALTCIDAIKNGAHVYVQKPISVDVMEGEAMVAAARKYNRVVQVGTQRRATPHLIDVKNQIIDKGLLGDIGHVEMCCYYPMRNNSNPPEQDIPDYFDYELWTGPAPMRPYDGLPHRGWWRAFREYSNGIVGDMCIHMFDSVRWMLALDWPSRISSEGGIYIQKEGKSNISDTQTAVFEYEGLNCVWQHRTWGNAVDPSYPWAFKIYGERGVLKADVKKAEFVPVDGSDIIRFDALYERKKYPEDTTEKDIELHAAPGTRGLMIDFLAAIENNSRPVADILQGHISTASCILANLSMDLKRPLIYDPETRTVKNDAEATALLTRAYRGNWIHPHPDKV